VGIIVWLIIFLVTIIIELGTLSLVTIWFSAGALIAIVIKFIGYNMTTQLIGFIITSILTFLLFRPILVKHIKNPKTKTNTDSLIGRTGEVVEEITPLTFGLVKVNGQVWTAKSVEDTLLKEGTMVEIIKIEGVKLIVKEKQRGSMECGFS